MISSSDITPSSRWIPLWGPPLAMAALIFMASSISTLTPLTAPRYSDKVLHFLVFAMFGLFLARAVAGTCRGKSGVFTFLVSFGLAWTYGITDEFHQLFVPGRTSDFMDLLFDWIGAATGIFLFLRFFHPQKRREPT